MNNSHAALVQALRETVGAVLVQESPYAVVAPRTVESAVLGMRVARNHRFRVMVLGTGSSFPPQFTILRDDVMAILSAGLAGAVALSPFAVRILAGTPVSALFSASVSPGRKTVGGLIAAADCTFGDVLLRALWKRVLALEVIAPTGECRRLAGPVSASSADPATANAFIGSRGRLGMIAAVELSPPIPLGAIEVESEPRGRAFGEDAAFSRRDLQQVLDPDAVFQW